MASRLYREGKGYVEDGVECESILVEFEYLESQLSAGWSVTPPGVANPHDSKAAEPNAVDPDEAVDPNEGVREAAKAAGIEGWDTKRISTLRKLLEA